MPSMALPALGTSSTVRCFRHRRTPVNFRTPQSNSLSTPVLLFNMFTVLCDVLFKDRVEKFLKIS